MAIRIASGRKTSMSKLQYRQMAISDDTEEVFIGTPSKYMKLLDEKDKKTLEAAIDNVEVDTTNLATKPELKTVTEHLTSVTTQLADTSTEISTLKNEKANKTYVDTQIATLGKIELKGVYPTLQALQTALPTGATGVYLVTADGFVYYWNDNTWIKGIQFQSTGIGENTITPENTTFLTTGKNKINTERDTVGRFFQSSSGSLATSDQYNTTDFIPVKNGESFVISPKIRKFLGFDATKKSIPTSYVDAITNNYTFTSTFDGYVRFSYYATDKNLIQMELGSTPTTYEAYGLIITKPLLNVGANEDSLNPLYNKKLLNFGDSIAAGSGNDNIGYAELLAAKNKMTVFDRAVGGATVTVIEGESNNIHVKIDDAIATNIQADYVLFNGGTNDAARNNLVVGTISTGYNSSLVPSTFCGSFELICKKLKLNWMHSKIIFVRVHNMDSRDSRQATYGDLATQMCKKWSIPVVDIYNDGGMNTHIPQMKLAYTKDTYNTGTGDGTHPNADGYNTFYVPMIEAKMKAV